MFNHYSNMYPQLLKDEKVLNPLKTFLRYIFQEVFPFGYTEKVMPVTLCKRMREYNYFEFPRRTQRWPKASLLFKLIYFSYFVYTWEYYPINWLNVVSFTSIYKSLYTKIKKTATICNNSNKCVEWSSANRTSGPESRWNRGDTATPGGTTWDWSWPSWTDSRQELLAGPKANTERCVCVCLCKCVCVFCRECWESCHSIISFISAASTIPPSLYQHLHSSFWMASATSWTSSRLWRLAPTPPQGPALSGCQEWATARLSSRLGRAHLAHALREHLMGPNA